MSTQQTRTTIRVLTASGRTWQPITVTSPILAGLLCLMADSLRLSYVRHDSLTA